MEIRRLAEITRVFLEEGLPMGQLDDDAPGRHDDADRGARLRRALERLGPTFIKFGQLLATRLDLFSPPFLAELAQLRAHVPPFPTPEAKAQLEAGYGRPLAEIFSEFPDAPFASASMAQVYRAVLREDARVVAVKVLRPGLAEGLERDLRVLIELSRIFDRLLPVYHRSMVHQVALEYAERARKESDLLAEARAMQSFAPVLAQVPEFRVPRVIEELSSPSVLVMDWLDGVMLDALPSAEALRAAGVEPRDLVHSLLRLQLVMSYEFGFVHGDTHPGNLIVLSPACTGLIDFGLHGQVPRKLCDQMLEFLFYQTSGQTEQAVKAFERLFGDRIQGQREAFERDIRALLEAPNEEMAHAPLTGQLVLGLRLGARHQLRAQSELLLVLRNLTVIEGIVMTYCPSLDVVAAARELLQGIMIRRAARGISEARLAELGPLFLLNVSQRPQLVQSLLRLERSFTDALDLGDFLRREGIFLEQRRRAPHWWMFSCGVLTALILVLLLQLTTR